MSIELMKAGFIFTTTALFALITNSSKIKLFIIKKIFKSKYGKVT